MILLGAKKQSRRKSTAANRHPGGYKIKTSNAKHWSFYGAGDEARTRYLHLGKVALYRMSYTRREHLRL